MKVSIDRIEGTVAVLISRADESVRVNVPLSLLPPDCRIGDIQATEAAQERVSGLIEKLKKRK
jgi:hypothetical protein